jgi:hypothetical protein
MLRRNTDYRRKEATEWDTREIGGGRGFVYIADN